MRVSECGGNDILAFGAYLRFILGRSRACGMLCYVLFIVANRAFVPMIVFVAQPSTLITVFDGSFKPADITFVITVI
jgi:hypothetical protein